MRRLLLTAVAAVALLAGCTGGDDATDGSTGDGTLAATGWVPGATASGGTLRLPIAQRPTNLNPATVDGAETGAAEVLAPATGSAVRWRADGSWEVDPAYAESVELTGTDPQTVTVRLNPDAVWSDGSPITASDMIAWAKALGGDDDRFAVATTRGWDAIRSVRQGDDRWTYTVRFDRPTAEWPRYVYPGGPAAVSKDPAAFSTGFTTKAMPGNGPYVVTRVADAAITLETNPRWWGEKPRLDRIVQRVVPDGRQADAFAGDDVDVADVGPDADLVEVAEQRDDSRLLTSAGSSWTRLAFNGSSGPLAEVAVRRALARAVDRRALADALGRPLGVDVPVQGSFLFVPGQRGADDVVGPTLSHDVAAARRQLADAGWRPGDDGVLRKGGRPLALSMVVPADTPSNRDRAEAIAGNLEEVGAKVTLREVPADDYFPGHVLALDFDLATFSWQGEPLPVADAQAQFFPKDAGQNVTGIGPADLGRLWTSANTALDPTTAQRRAGQIDARLAELVPFLPLTPVPEAWVVDSRLRNLGPSLFEQPDWAAVGFAKD